MPHQTTEGAIRQASEMALGLLQKNNWLWSNGFGKLPRVRKGLVRLTPEEAQLMRQIEQFRQSGKSKAYCGD